MTGALFQPYELRDVTLPNRIVLAPLARCRAGAARIPNALMALYYSLHSVYMPEGFSLNYLTTRLVGYARP